MPRWRRRDEAVRRRLWLRARDLGTGGKERKGYAMTVTAIAATQQQAQPFAVLRRAKLTQRHALLVAAIASGWSHGNNASFADLMRGSGYRSLNGVAHALLRLQIDGWIKRPFNRWRSVSPGPRFAGLDHGWPLECVKA